MSCRIRREKQGKALERRQVVASARKVGGSKSRTLRFVWTDPTYDSFRTVLLPSGWGFRRYEKNPVLLWSHMAMMPPIAKAKDRGTEPLGDERAKDDPDMVKWWVDAEFPSRSVDEFGHGIFQLASNDFIRATSAGFDPDKKSIRSPEEEEFEKFGIPEADAETAKIYARNELAEVSLVSLPANENAVKTYRAIDDAFERKWNINPISGLSTPENFRERLMRIYYEISGKRYEGDWEEYRAKDAVQVVIFSREEGDWTVEKAKAWLDDHDLKSDRMEETDISYRFRQSESDDEGERVLTENLPEGVAMIVREIEAVEVEEPAPEPVSSGTSASWDVTWTTSTPGTVQVRYPQDDMKAYIDQKFESLREFIADTLDRSALAGAARQSQGEESDEFEMLIDENLETFDLMEQVTRNLTTPKGKKA